MTLTFAAASVAVLVGGVTAPVATLWLTLGIVGTLTLGLTAAAVRLKVGIPATVESGLLKMLARRRPPETAMRGSSQRGWDEETTTTLRAGRLLSF